MFSSTAARVTLSTQSLWIWRVLLEYSYPFADVVLNLIKFALVLFIYSLSISIRVYKANILHIEFNVISVSRELC